MKTIKMSSMGILLLALTGGTGLAFARPAPSVGKSSRGSRPPVFDFLGGKTTSDLSSRQQTELQNKVEQQEDFTDQLSRMVEKRDNVLDGVSFVVRSSAPSMSSKQAHKLVVELLKKSKLEGIKKKADTKTHQSETVANLVASVVRHPSLAKSMQELRDNVAGKKAHFKPGDYENMLTFASSLKVISPAAMSAKSFETAALVVGARLGEISTWTGSARDNVMLMVRTYIKEYASSSGPAQAMFEAQKVVNERKGKGTNVAAVNEFNKELVKECKI